MALQGYYEGIVPLVDSLVETYQGKYGIVSGYTNPQIKDLNEPESILKYMKALLSYVNKKRAELPKDTNIQNSIDTIVDLIQSTIYKLTYLK